MKTLRLVVVDTNADARRQLIEAIEEDADLRVVGEAADADDAAVIVGAERPDLAVVDIRLPDLRGLDAIDLILGRHLLPILAVTAQAGSTRGELIFQAVRRGAIDVAGKPRTRTEAAALREQIRRIAAVPVKARLTQSAPMAVYTDLVPDRRATPSGRRVVAIAASAGGPRAVASILAGLPETFPAAVIVVQHLPAGFAKPFARYLKGQTRLPVTHVEDSVFLEPARVFVAPDDHPVAVTAGERLVVLDAGEHRPADVLFHSLADHLGPAAIGVVLSGIGNDGTEGLLALRARGALTIAQDETTAIVDGMPRAARDAGAAEQILSLPAIAPLLLKMV